MGRVRWRAVLVGAVASLLIWWAVAIIVGYGYLYGPIGLVTLLAAHLAGGILAGRVSSLSPGLNGVVAVAFAALYLFARFLVDVPPLILGPTDDPRTRSEYNGLVVFQWMVVGLLLPFVLLSGYLGGRIGGLLRRTSGGDDRVVS